MDIPKVILAEDIKPYIDHIVHIGDLCTGRFHTIHRFMLYSPFRMRVESPACLLGTSIAQVSGILNKD